MEWYGECNTSSLDTEIKKKERPNGGTAEVEEIEIKDILLWCPPVSEEGRERERQWWTFFSIDSFSL